jgi:hypothetical protein
MANLTGKTIGELTLLTGITSNTLFAVELSGVTYHIPYSGLSTDLGSYEEITYSELYDKYTGSTLTPSRYYLITDYRTCYDRPDYNKYKNPIAVSNDSYVSAATEPVLVFATSNNTFSVDAYQPSYPNDKIKYDITYSLTESGNPAFGRITERIDEYGNRSDYDNRTIEFKRYLLRTYDRYNPLQGNVELQGDGTVLGSGTNFTALTAGQIIAIRFSNEVFYEIVSIADDFTMTVTGETITATGGGGYSFFNANSHSNDSYYPNNIDGQLNYALYKTFDQAENENCYNTYIGDHSKYFINESIGDFLLANNVLKSGRYDNNTIGDSSYNNTFNDDCTANRIGYGFRNNITDDDFDSNVIGNFFNNNIITANFIHNHIGINFEDNVIICSDFWRNQIGNDFRDNWIDGDWGFDFQNNQIGNQFNNNQIYKAFYKNVILNGYNNNETWDETQGNQIGNGFNYNNIYSQFYENIIGDYYQNNTISDSNNIGSYSFYRNRIGYSYTNNTIVGNFFNNEIGNDFTNNAIQTNFAFNKIGSQFQFNGINVDFGFGGSQARGNVIGNLFNNNNIGEYFYDNIIGDNFGSNTIGDDFTNNKVDYGFQSNTIGFNFQNNDIKVSVFVGADFASNQGNVLAVNFNTPAGSDNTYTNVSPSSTVSAYGVGVTFDITVAGGAVTNVAVNQVGKLYQVNDTFVILGSLFGGVNGVDLNLTVTSATVPFVNKTANCTIFRDEDGNPFLSYIDNTGTLQVILP